MTPSSLFRGRSRRGGSHQTPPSSNPALPSIPDPAASPGIPGSAWSGRWGPGTGVSTGGLEGASTPPGSIPVPAFPGPQVLPAFPAVSQASFLREVGSPWGSSEHLGAPASQAGIPIGVQERPHTSLKSIVQREEMDWEKMEPSRGSHAPPPPPSSHGKTPVVVVLSMLDFHGITHFQAIL